MATLEIQPCESCGTKTGSGDDLYQRARPGSKAIGLAFRFERLCADCRPDVSETAGGPWEIPPPKPGAAKRRGFR